MTSPTKRKARHYNEQEAVGNVVVGVRAGLPVLQTGHRDAVEAEREVKIVNPRDLERLFEIGLVVAAGAVLLVAFLAGCAPTKPYPFSRVEVIHQEQLAPYVPAQQRLRMYCAKPENRGQFVFPDDVVCM
jgi:hypothetical protein